MKLAYFGQKAADGDDYILQEMIAIEAVPPGCLLGGNAVRRFHNLGMVPCEECPFQERKRCGSTIKQTEESLEKMQVRAVARGLSSSAEKLGNDSASARKVMREEYNREILWKLNAAEKVRREEEAEEL